MSTDDPTPGHPSFEVLSAHFDGEAPEVAAHAAGCRECRLTLRWLGAASALVATPVPPLAPSAREDAVARAMEAFERPREMVATGPSTPTLRVEPRPAPRPTPVPVPAPVVPIDRARDRRAERAGRGAGLWVGIGSAAAVVLAVVVGLGVVGGSGGRHETVAAGPAQERTTFDTVGAGIAAAGDSGRLPTAADTFADGGGASGGDLGDIADADALAARAAPALAQRQSAPAAPAPEAALTSEAATSTAASPPKAAAARPCEAEVRAARPGLGTVVYDATGQVRGAPVVVLGFDPGPGNGPVTLLALAPQEGCRAVLEAAGP